MGRVPAAIALSLGIVATFACTTTELTTSTEPSPLKCQVTLTSSLSTVEATGGAANARVEAQPECAWTVSSDVTWIANPSPEAGQGAADVSFNVAPNAESVPRQGTLAVNDSRLRISQAPAPCRFEVSPRTLTLGRAGAAAPLAVTAGVGCAWTATPDATWLTVNPASGTGPATVTVVAPANPGLVRISSVTVAGIVVVTSQEAFTPANCQSTLQPASATAAATGGPGPSVSVTLPSGCNWTAQSSVSWLTVTSDASGDSPGVVNFTVAANTGAQRSGVLSIAGQAFTVTQAAAPAPCSFNVAPTTLAAPAGGGALVGITVTTASGCAWTATSQAPWLTFGSSASGSGSGSVQLLAASNSGAARSAIATIAATTVNVTQAAVACTYGINPSNQSIGSGGGAGSAITVTAPPPCAWTATTPETWIAITSSATGTGNGTVYFTIASNPGPARTGTLSVAGQTFTVNQSAAPAPCTYQITPSSQSAPSAGGAGSAITVTTASGCTWTASTPDAWITITPGATGTGNGTVNFSIASNPGAARAGTLSVAGQTFTVNQAAAPAPCTYQITPSSQSAPSAGGAGSTITVTTASGCAWTATSPDAWLTITSGATGTGSGTVNFTISANPGAARTGTLTAGGQVFTVNQAAAPAPCTYQINPSSQSFPAAAGAGTNIAVTTASGCAWTASTTDSWIAIGSGTPGNGNGTVTFSVSANTGPARTGSMLVAGRTFNVSQASGCAFQINPTSQSISAAGGPGTNIAVTAASGCTWTASTPDIWINITSGTPGSGNGTVAFTIASTNGPARTGSLSVAGQTFAVNQASGCVVQISPPSQTIPGAAGSGGSFNVTAGTGCAWTAVKNDPWLTITAGASGSGNGSVTYTATANSMGGHASRVGTISVVTKTFTVTQLNINP
jgi:hypothetical protein